MAPNVGVNREADELSGAYRNPERAGICSPLIDADGSMAYSQPALDGELPPDPVGYLGDKKEK